MSVFSRTNEPRESLLRAGVKARQWMHGLLAVCAEAHQVLSQWRARSLLLTTFTLLFGLHIFRIFLPTVTWYLGRYLSAVQLGLYALGTFALTLLAPIMRRRLGERGALALAIGGLALVRLIIQLARSPLANLVLATAGLGLLGWFIPLWRESLRNCPTPNRVPILAVAFPLALLLDTVSRSLLLSYDLAWRYDWGAILFIASLVVWTLILLWRELQEGKVGQTAEESPLSHALPLIRLGLWFYLTLAITHNPSTLMAATGWSDATAHLVVNGLALLGLVAYVELARSPSPSVSLDFAVVDERVVLHGNGLRRWPWKLLGGGLLVAALILFFVGIGPGWLWVGLASLNSWAALGEGVTGASGRASSPPALADSYWPSSASVHGVGNAGWRSRWHSAAITFATLLTVVVAVIVVSEHDLLWMTPLVGGILLAVAAWAMHVQPGRRVTAVSETDGTSLSHTRPSSARQGCLGKAGRHLFPGAVVGTIVMGILLPVGIRGRFNDSPGFVEAALPDRPLRVMTYNIHHGIDADWRLDLKAIARVIALEDPDVIVLNEVNRARPSNGFVDTLPIISRQLRMVYVFGANQRDGLYGNAVLSRYPILEWDNKHYTHNTTQVRGLLHVVVDAPGGPVTILGTHLDHLDHQHARAEQVTELLEAWAGAPRTVLLGDLNAEPQAPELSAIYTAGFVDVLAESGLDDVFTFWDPVPSRRLDFIFVTPDLPLVQAWVVPSRASDHLPVLAEVGP